MRPNEAEARRAVVLHVGARRRRGLRADLLDASSAAEAIQHMLVGREVDQDGAEVAAERGNHALARRLPVDGQPPLRVLIVGAGIYIFYRERIKDESISSSGRLT